MLPPLPPQYRGKMPRADFLQEHFPNLKDQREDLPEFKPKGEIGIEQENLDQKAYELYGPPKSFQPKVTVDRTLEKMNKQLESLKNLDENYHQDLLKHSDPGPRIITYD